MKSCLQSIRINIHGDVATRLGVLSQAQEGFLDIGRMLQHSEAEHPIKALFGERDSIDVRLYEVQVWEQAVIHQAGINGVAVVKRKNLHTGIDHGLSESTSAASCFEH